MTTKAGKERKAILKRMQCIVCRNLGETQKSETDVHHIKRDPKTGLPLGGQEKAPDSDTIPLCRRKHHWNSVHVSMGSKEFERLYGNELDLLDQVNQILALGEEESA